jgi:hypothetical protein
VLRKIFGRKRDEVTGEWRKLHDEELYDLYSSQYIIRGMESRRMRSAAHVACTGTGSWWENPRDKDRFVDLDLDGKIILKCILK